MHDGLWRAGERVAWEEVEKLSKSGKKEMERKEKSSFEGRGTGCEGIGWEVLPVQLRSSVQEREVGMALGGRCW